MKKLLLIPVVFFTLAVASCSKNDPQSVAKEWLTSFYHMDFDEAKKYSTDDTKEVLTNFQSFTNLMSDSIKQRAKKAEITIKGVKIDGDKAEVTFLTSEENHEMPPLKLIKQNEKWLVAYTKVDFLGAAPGDETPAAGGATITQGTPGEGVPAADTAAVLDSSDMKAAPAKK